MEESTFRIIPADEYYEAPKPLSEAGKIIHTILAEAEEKAAHGLADVSAAIEMLGIMKPSHHRDLTVRVGQLLEEIRELRRLRG